MNAWQQMRVAHWGHRLSGLALAAFLPAHFWVLAEALQAARETGGEATFIQSPGWQWGLWLLLGALVAHAGFGLRVLVIEYGPSSSPARLYLGWIWLVLSAALFFTVLFGWWHHN
tara:strand:+ start:955 stop:1299 length:345 start_codon:yes stop_codon:yes gene_type:complete